MIISPSDELLELAPGVPEAIAADGVRAYPAECCGILIGKGRYVAGALSAANLADTGRQHDRYRVDPLAIVRAERAASAEGLEIIGFYHSHPDHPAQASTTDAALAWEGYVYVIVSVRKKEPAEMRAWQREPAPSTALREVRLLANS